MARDTEIGVLLDAINDVQETICAFDVKAEILTGILTLVIGLVAFQTAEADARCSSV